MSSPKSSLCTPLPSVSHLGAVAAVTRKQDSAGLTPTLSNYVNTHLVDHIACWQTDTAEKQVLCSLFQNKMLNIHTYGENKTQNCHVTACAVAQSCCVSDVSCQREGRFFDPHSSKIRGSIPLKLKFKKHIRGTTPHAKYG